MYPRWYPACSHPPRTQNQPPGPGRGLALLPLRPFELLFRLSLLRSSRTDESNDPFVVRGPGDMEIKSIPLFRGLHREIGSYFICAIKTRTMTRRRRSGRTTTTTVPLSQAPQAEGCTRPDLLIDTPIVCSPSACLSLSPFSFRRYFFRLLSYSWSDLPSNAFPDCMCRVTYITIPRRWLRVHLEVA